MRLNGIAILPDVVDRGMVVVPDLRSIGNMQLEHRGVIVAGRGYLFNVRIEQGFVCNTAGIPRGNYFWRSLAVSHAQRRQRCRKENENYVS